MHCGDACLELHVSRLDGSVAGGVIGRDSLNDAQDAVDEAARLGGAAARDGSPLVEQVAERVANRGGVTRPDRRAKRLQVLQDELRHFKGETNESDAIEDVVNLFISGKQRSGRNPALVSHLAGA